MKTGFYCFVIGMLCAWQQAVAQDVFNLLNLNPEPDWMKLDVVPQKAGAEVTHEIDFSESYVGGSDIHRGSTSYGNLSENHFNLNYVANIPVAPNWQLRVGALYERFDFGSLRGSLLPNTLGSAAMILGADVNLSDQWLLRIEIHPGVYSDFRHVTFDQVNVPIIIGATYLVNSDLQWFMGIQIDPHFGTGIYHFIDSPVMPGAGVRWHFADRWTLMAVLPSPELQFDATDKLQLYTGARVLGGNYRMNNHFGDASGEGKLSKANLNYMEVRAALGLRYTLSPGFVLELEAGSAVTRQFYYSGADMQFHTDPAPYGQIHFQAQF